MNKLKYPLQENRKIELTANKLELEQFNKKLPKLREKKRKSTRRFPYLGQLAKCSTNK